MHRRRDGESVPVIHHRQTQRPGRQDRRRCVIDHHHIGVTKQHQGPPGLHHPQQALRSGVPEMQKNRRVVFRGVPGRVIGAGRRLHPREPVRAQQCGRLVGLRQCPMHCVPPVTQQVRQRQERTHVPQVRPQLPGKEDVTH
jgi:hypothetical protein